MKSKLAIRWILVLGLVVVASQSKPLLAQRFEINPYGGGIFPTEFADVSNFKDEGIYGVRGGLFVRNNLMVEGNFGYINHFEFDDTDPQSSAFLWEANGTYHFFLRNSRITPFVTGGIGGLTLSLDGDGEQFFQAQGLDRIVPIAGPGAVTGSGQVFRFGDSDSFLSFNYGGGVKATSLWGPLGLRFDARARTLPNFIGSRQNTWFETSGGLTFSWGE